MNYLLLIVMTWLGSLGAFFLKKCSECATGLVSLLKSPPLYLGGALYGAGMLLNVALLRQFDYSVLYPMSAVTYIWSLLLSKWLLKEKVTKKKLMGILCICTGVFLVAIG